MWMCVQDPDVVTAAVIDVAGTRPAALVTGERTYTYSLLEDTLFSTRPGLRILQMTWHPGTCPWVLVIPGFPFV
jgi:hypothetical protein